MSLSPTTPVRDLLLKACQEGNLELASVLLANGADLNWREDALWPTGLWSGLHYAAHGGHRALLNLLLAHPRVDVNIETEYRQTPLMLACSVGHQIIVQRLLQVEGLLLNAQDIWGETALHKAVPFSGCVQQLKGAPGLDWNLKNISGETPLLQAARGGYADSLQVILTVPQPYLDLTATNYSGHSVTWLAVRTGNSVRCLQLLSDDPGVEWNSRDEAGDTPLLSCLKNNTMEFAKVLLNNPRVDPQVQDKEGRYPETIAR